MQVLRRSNAGKCFGSKKSVWEIDGMAARRTNVKRTLTEIQGIGSSEGNLWHMPKWKTIKHARFKENHGFINGARTVFERAEFFGDDHMNEKLFIA